jgi:ribosomal protein L7/L12
MTIWVAGIATVMVVVLTILIVLWAFTEELPRANRVPLYEQMEEGTYAVRLIGVGRRKLKAVRVVNEVIGGNYGAAIRIVEEAPIVLIEGINQASATLVVEALHKAEAEAEVIHV